MSKPPLMTVLVDTREQCVPPFPPGVTLERRMLKEGDYSTPLLADVARIERKSVCDFASTLSWGRQRFERELDRLRALRWKCVVVEGEITQVYRVSAMHPHSVLGSIASLTARWDCPVLFVGNEAACGRVMAGLLRRWEERYLADAIPSVPQSSPSEEAALVAAADEALA